MYETIKKNFNDMLDVIYNYIKDVVKNHNNFINTSYGAGDNIYSLEFGASGEVYEYKILGVRVVADELQFCSSYDNYEAIDDETLNNDSEFDWYDVKCMEGYYPNTLYNIFEHINDYIK